MTKQKICKECEARKAEIRSDKYDTLNSKKGNAVWVFIGLIFLIFICLILALAFLIWGKTSPEVLPFACFFGTLDIGIALGSGIMLYVSGKENEINNLDKEELEEQIERLKA